MVGSQKQHRRAASSYCFLFIFLIATLPTPSLANACSGDDTILGALFGILDPLLGLVGCLLGIVPPGVTCNAQGCVVGLVLNTPTLTGTIPSQVGQLVHLVNLVIQNTSYSVIPSTFANLNKLLTLDLSNNSLVSGLENLPLLLPNVTRINLSNNKFTSLPLLGNGSLPSLVHFIASNNLLTDVSNLAGSLLKSTLLTVVDLSNNALTLVDFTLIRTVNALGNIIHLLLSGNDISGLLLDLIQFLATLPLNIVLDLSDNYFCGLIPPLASRIIAADRLILNDNCFFDPLPNWCSVYANTCTYMKSSSVCSPVTSVSYCPPVFAGNSTLLTTEVSTTIQNGPAAYIVPVLYGQTATSGVSLNPTTIMEVDANGNPVNGPNTTQILPTEIFKRYYVDNLTLADGVQGTRISTILNNGAFFFWELYMDSQSFIKNYVNTQRTIDPNKLTELIEVSYWPAVSPNTTGFALDFEIDFGGSAVVSYNNGSIANQSFSQNFSGASAFSSNFVLESNNTLTANVTLVNIAYGNNNASYNITHVLTHAESDGTTAHLRALIPFTFYPSMYYDPDVGVLFGDPGDSGVHSSSSGGVSGDGSGGFNDNYIAAIVAPIGLLVLAVPAVVIVIVVILIAKKAALVSWMHKTGGPDEKFVTV